VTGLLEENGQGASTYDVTQIDSGTNVILLNGEYALAAGPDVALAVTRTTEGALQQGQKLIINLSLQTPNAPNDGQDREGCEGGGGSPLCSSQDGTNYASWKADELSFLTLIAGTLQYMPPAEQANTHVVVSAGNSGLDLTNEIGLLRRSFPVGLDEMIIVGSFDTNLQPFLGHNFSNNLGDMLFSPGVDVTVPNINGCVASGTSLAAAAVANLAAQLAQQYPALPAGQIGAAVMGAAPQINGLLTIPTLQEAGTAAELVGELLGVQFTGTVGGTWFCGSFVPECSYGGTITIQATFVSGASGIAGNWEMSGSLCDSYPCMPYGNSGNATFNVRSDGSVSVTMSNDTCGFSGSGTSQSLSGSGDCADFNDTGAPVSWSATANVKPSGSTSLRAKRRNSKPRP
jgi:hypothetical protein